MHLTNPEILLDSYYALQFIYILQIAAICHVIVMPGTPFNLFHLFSFFLTVIIFPMLTRITFGKRMDILMTVY